MIVTSSLSAMLAEIDGQRAIAIMQYEVSSELLRIQIREQEANLAMLVETEAALRNLINTMGAEPRREHPTR